MGVTEKAVLYSRSRFSRELSEIGAVKPDRARLLRGAPAAFRRLCVETRLKRLSLVRTWTQPPLGGWVLKPPMMLKQPWKSLTATFGSLCVKTLAATNFMPTYPVSSLREAVCSNIVQAGRSSFDPSLSEALVKAVGDIRSKL